MPDEEPSVEGRQAFRAWLADAPASRPRLSPSRELLAEHYVMTSVLRCMDSEARRLKGGEPLRTFFWSAVTDFNGNFVHMGHRVKEELHYIPALIEGGLIERGTVEAFHDEHDRAKQLTLNISGCVQRGDWEAVLRFVVLYVHFLPNHMREEESRLFRIGAEMSPESNGRLRTAFDEIDRNTLAGGSRTHYVDLARQLCAASGIEYDLGHSQAAR